MSIGELNTRVRRSGVVGANTQVIFNNNGLEGASPNLTFDGQNLVVSGTNVVSSIAAANATGQTGITLAIAANTFAQTRSAYAQTGVLINGTLSGNGINLNFVAGNTSNLNISATQNTNPGNVTITIDTRNPPGGGGGGTPSGSNGNLQFDNNGVFGGATNASYNLVSNTVQVDGNVALGNASAILLGGSSSNTANAQWSIAYNVTSHSIDFLFI